MTKLRQLLTMELRLEHDVVLARQRARQIAAEVGFSAQDQTRIATAVSEIVRNAFRYAHGGRVTFSLEDGVPPKIWVRVEDQGPGISNLSEIMEGRFASSTGMGLGIIGTKRIMDGFEIDTGTGRGTVVRFAKTSAQRTLALQPGELGRIVAALAAHAPEDALSEVRRQNAELLQALDELRRHQEALATQQRALEVANRNLAETNRGVRALNVELEDRAEALRVATEGKSRFLSHITHEFRTPVNSILSLTRILSAEDERHPMSAERLKQVGFVRSAAETLSQMVNDLLDTAKADAGRLEVRADAVDMAEVFGALRGMCRPLLSPERSVDLVFDIPSDFPALFTDESKVAQILRNLLSNAIKFTEHGVVRVSARSEADDGIAVDVSDSGVGIQSEDQERVFEEFTQIAGPHQRRSKGTGLGLPLARRLARLLGGDVSLKSESGRGSTFTMHIPRRYHGLEGPVTDGPQVGRTEAGGAASVGRAGGKILMIDDDEVARYIMADLLRGTTYTLVEAANGADGIARAREIAPRVILLDLHMPGMNGFEVLEALSADPATSAIPIVINSSKPVTSDAFRMLGRVPVAVLCKSEPFSRREAVDQIVVALRQAGLSVERQKGAGP